MEDGNFEDLIEVEESILLVLLHESRHNDSHRFLAGLRGPSRLQHRFMDCLTELYEQRKAEEESYKKEK